MMSNMRKFLEVFKKVWYNICRVKKIIFQYLKILFINPIIISKGGGKKICRERDDLQMRMLYPIYIQG